MQMSLSSYHAVKRKELLFRRENTKMPLDLNLKTWMNRQNPAVTDNYGKK